MIRFENLQFSEFLIFVKFVFFSFHHSSHSYWAIVKWNENFAAHVRKIRFFIRQRFRLKKWKQQLIVSLFYLRCESEKKNLKCAKWNEILSFFFQKFFLTKFVLQFLKINILRIFFRLNFFFMRFFTSSIFSNNRNERFQFFIIDESLNAISKLLQSNWTSAICFTHL